MTPFMKSSALLCRQYNRQQLWQCHLMHSRMFAVPSTPQRQVRCPACSHSKQPCGHSRHRQPSCGSPCRQPPWEWHTAMWCSTTEKPCLAQALKLPCPAGRAASSRSGHSRCSQPGCGGPCRAAAAGGTGDGGQHPPRAGRANGPVERELQGAADGAVPGRAADAGGAGRRGCAGDHAGAQSLPTQPVRLRNNKGKGSLLIITL